MKNLLSILAVLVFAAFAAKAATSGPVNGQAKAKIIAPVTLAHADGAWLNFGIIVSPAAAGTRIVTPAGISSGGTLTVFGEGDSVSADAFTVAGLGAGEHYAISLPSSVTISDTASPAHTMTVDGFNHDAGAEATAATFNVGGTLHVAANQAAGEYQGTYEVTITY